MVFVCDTVNIGFLFAFMEGTFILTTKGTLFVFFYFREVNYLAAAVMNEICTVVTVVLFASVCVQFVLVFAGDVVNVMYCIGRLRA